jgi:glycosyltransferase involved in cell wall biosynthesis
MSARHCFIVPDLDGPISGGTLYDRELIAALRASGVDCRALDLAAARRVLGADDGALFWLDSLLLSALPELEAAARGRVGLVLHYLPSLLRRGDELSRAELAAEEIFALDNAARYLLPSAFMKRTLERLGAPARQMLVVEPGRPAPLSSNQQADGRVQALLVANLVPNKGVEPLLAALTGELAPSDRFELEVVGSCDVDPHYAGSCRRWLEHPSLAGRVRLLGALAPQHVLARMVQSNLLISASRMESYGMVLAEARALGVPIIARRGGNSVEHVLELAGGEIVDSDSELAKACVRLCRDPGQHELRLDRARESRLAARPWSEAAREFLLQVSAGLSAPTA